MKHLQILLLYNVTKRGNLSLRAREKNIPFYERKNRFAFTAFRFLFLLLERRVHLWHGVRD